MFFTACGFCSLSVVRQHVIVASNLIRVRVCVCAGWHVTQAPALIPMNADDEFRFVPKSHPGELPPLAADAAGYGFFIDPGRAISTRISSYLNDLERAWRFRKLLDPVHNRCTSLVVSGAPKVMSATRPMLICWINIEAAPVLRAALVDRSKISFKRHRPQTGKTFILEDVFPAIVGGHGFFGSSGSRRAEFFRFDTTSYDRTAGVKGFLAGLLYDMALVTGVSLDTVFNAAAAAADPLSYMPELTAILRLYDSLSSDGPHFFLVDEVSVSRRRLPRFLQH